MKENKGNSYSVEYEKVVINPEHYIIGCDCSVLKDLNDNKYKYCYGDEGLKRMVDELEKCLRDNGVLFSTYLLRELFITRKANQTGILTVKVDKELLVKFDFYSANNQFTLHIEKSPNMPELLAKTNYYN